MNTIKIIVMLTAVLSMGGFFASQQAMAGTSQVGVTAIATIDASCSLTPGSFNFGTLDTVAHATGSPEITVGMANSAASNAQSSVTVSGADWVNTSTPPTAGSQIMVVGNTQFDTDNTSGGPYTALTGSQQGLIVVPPGGAGNTFWIVLAILNGGAGSGFTGTVSQSITLEFACV